MGDPGSPDRGWAPYLPEGYDPGTTHLISASSSPEDVNLEQLQRLEPDLVIGTATSNEDQQALLPKLELIPPTILVECGGARSRCRPFVSVSPERLLDGDAPVVFVLPNADNGQTAAKNAALNNPLWMNLQAVKANKAFTVDYAYWGSSNY